MKFLLQWSYFKPLTGKGWFVLTGVAYQEPLWGLSFVLTSLSLTGAIRNPLWVLSFLYTLLFSVVLNCLLIYVYLLQHLAFGFPAKWSARIAFHDEGGSILQYTLQKVYLLKKKLDAFEFHLSSLFACLSLTVFSIDANVGERPS